MTCHHRLDQNSDAPSSQDAKHCNVELHVLDPHGDLTLRIVHETSTQEAQVCSRTLARTSKYFAALLYGGFSECEAKYDDASWENSGGGGSGNSSWTVRVEELDPSTLVSILRYLHSTNVAHMKSLAGVEICEIVRMVNYLGCEKALHDLVPVWRRTIQQEIYHESEKYYADVLLAAIFLGLDDLAAMILNRLQADVNKISRSREFSKLTARTLKDMDDPLTYKDYTPVEIDPMLEAFDIESSLKENRDALWLEEDRRKAQALYAYQFEFAEYLPSQSSSGASRGKAVCRIADVDNATLARRAETLASEPTKQHHMLRATALCQALKKRRMSRENFEPATHKSVSLIACLRKLRRLCYELRFAEPWLRGLEFPTEQLLADLRNWEKEFAESIEEYNTFPPSDEISDFLQKQKKLYGF